MKNLKEKRNIFLDFIYISPIVLILVLSIYLAKDYVGIKSFLSDVNFAYVIAYGFISSLAILFIQKDFNLSIKSYMSCIVVGFFVSTCIVGSFFLDFILRIIFGIFLVVLLIPVYEYLIPYTMRDNGSSSTELNFISKEIKDEIHKNILMLNMNKKLKYYQDYFLDCIIRVFLDDDKLIIACSELKGKELFKSKQSDMIMSMYKASVDYKNKYNLEYKKVEDNKEMFTDYLEKGRYFEKIKIQLTENIYSPKLWVGFLFLAFLIYLPIRYENTLISYLRNNYEAILNVIFGGVIFGIMTYLARIYSRRRSSEKK